VIPIAEAQELVLAACGPRETVELGLAEALGRVLAEPVTAAHAVPPFPNTAMDGFAVRAVDLQEASEARPVRLRVVGTLAAGAAPDRVVGAGEALRIMTGAPFPDGADAVAIVETTSTQGDDVLVRAPVKAGDHLRAAGEDVQAGQEVFPAATVLGPGHLGVLASVGRTSVNVVRAPTVGVLSTGDELVDGAAPLAPGQIRDSNRTTLLGLLRRDGYPALDLGIARDDADQLRSRLLDAAARCDAVLTSGGVSMGDYDLVKKVLDDLGDMRWLQIAIRPAKPFAFGTVGPAVVFGLPGNPVSSMVSYELLARPGLRRMEGLPDDQWHRRSVPAVAEEPLRASADGRITYARVRAVPGEDGRWRVRAAGGQGSHQLHAMATANALAVVAPSSPVEAGGSVDILLLGP
jgi:molybdenum cofactor synthesis domain-containing protein